jgi:cytochrome c
MRCWCVATLVMTLAPGLPARAGGDPMRGERAFQRCFACHSVDPGETARLDGPSLFRLIGRRAATVPGFDYSPALRAAGAQGLVWDAAALDRLIMDPEAVVPGIRMGPVGRLDPEERADIIAYLARAGAR